MFGIILVPLIAAGFVILMIGLAAWYVADLLTRTKRRRVEGSPADLGLRYEDVQFASPDGVILRGWYLESPGARASMILVHDLEGTRSEPTVGLLDLQRDYVRRGFHVLAFDLRGRGESGGGRDHFGCYERRDVGAAVAYARSRAGGLPLLLHGFGVGASLAIVAVADGAAVECVIADSPVTSVRAYLRERWSQIPAPLFWLSSNLARRFFGADMDALAPLDAVRRVAPTRVLFIHGEGDRFAPAAHTLNLAAASMTADDELWRIPGAGHCGGYRRDPEEYLRRCLAFIDGALPIRRPVASAG